MLGIFQRHRSSVRGADNSEATLPLAASGGFYDLAYEWARKAEYASFEEPNDPEEFPGLDGKLAAKLAKISRGDLHRQCGKVTIWQRLAKK